jgi:hypothetical protein
MTTKEKKRKEKEIVCTHSKANGCYREWREGVGGIRVPPQKNIPFYLQSLIYSQKTKT